MAMGWSSFLGGGVAVSQGVGPNDRQVLKLIQQPSKGAINTYVCAAHNGLDDEQNLFYSRIQSIQFQLGILTIL